MVFIASRWSRTQGLLEGQRDRQKRAPAHRRVDAKSPAQMGDALLHSNQTETLLHVGPESSSIILDQNVDVFRPLFDGDPDRLGAGVTNTVVQGLLHHAVNASLVLLEKAVGNPVHGYIDLN